LKDKKWLAETDPVLLMLKLNEEIGEITHAFIRGNEDQVLVECNDAALILERLRTVVSEIEGIPEIRPERYR
jgi:NTP pyrophosphatase (non-canonical NTP hydrolase)